MPYSIRGDIRVSALCRGLSKHVLDYPVGSVVQFRSYGTESGLHFLNFGCFATIFDLLTGYQFMVDKPLANEHAVLVRADPVHRIWFRNTKMMSCQLYPYYIL